MAINQATSVEQSVQLAVQAQIGGGQGAQQVLYDYTAIFCDPFNFEKALEYLNQFKASPDAWRICLDMVTRPTAASTNEVRFFALQTLEEIFKGNRYKSLDSQARTTLRLSLMEYCNQQFSSSGKTLPVFMRNKLSHAIVLLMAQQYPQEWPSFFDEILQWSQPANASIELVDFFLRLCLDIDEEIVCLFITRSDEDTQRNTNIKDAMRKSAVARLVNAWLQVLSSYYPANPKLAITCLKLLSIYVGWIDISLVVNDTVIPALYEFLGDATLRVSAAECLTEIIGKGMKPPDKLHLIQSLRLYSILEPLQLGNDSDFDDSVARLVDITGESLCHILTELPDLLSEIWPELERYYALMLRLMSLDYINEDSDSRDDVCASLIPFSTAFLLTLKKEKKRNTPLDYSGYLGHFLNVISLKMKYASTFIYGSSESLDAVDMQSSREFKHSKSSVADAEEDEEEKAFLSRRNQMKILFENINSIDAALVEQYVSSAVSQAIQMWNKCSSFADLELALHILFIYAESIKTTVFVDTKSRQLTSLGQLVYLFFSTPELTSYPHPTIPLIYFETAVRYATFLITPIPADISTFSLLPNIMSAFIGNCGVHHSLWAIQRRVWYLLNRFVRMLVTGGALKEKPEAAELCRNAISALRDLAVIVPEAGKQSDLPSKTPITSPGGDSSTAAMRNETALNLFEVIGLLASNVPEERDQLAQVLQLATAQTVDQMSGLMNEIVSRKTSGGNGDMTNPAISTLGSCMQGLGALAKGFADGSGKAFSCQQHPTATAMLKRLLEINISVLEILRDTEPIREARFYIILGGESFPYLRPMIQGFSHPSLTIKEATDIFPFLSAFLYKNRQEILPVLDEILLPVIQKAFEFLGTGAVPEGEEGRQLVELQRAYLQFLISLFTNDCDMVFLSPTNSTHLKAILESLVHFAKNSQDGQVQKFAFNFMFRLLTSWYPGSAVAVASSTAATKKPSPSNAAIAVPATSTPTTDRESSKRIQSQHSHVSPKQNPIPPPAWLQQWLMSELTVACWQAPLYPEFHLDYLGNSKASAAQRQQLQLFGDSQCLVVVNEVAMLVKAMTGLDPTFVDLMINQQVLRQMMTMVAPRWGLDPQRTQPVCEWISRESSAFWSSAKTMDTKQWKQFFKEFIKAIRLQFFTQARTIG